MPTLALATDDAESVDKQNVLKVFVRDGCAHCAKAKDYLNTLAEERPKVEIVVLAVDKDEAARDELLTYSRAAGIWPPGVPTFVFNKEVFVGFDSAEETRAELINLIDRRLVIENTVETGLFGEISVERLGLPAFTLALGLLDGFNPCAMWLLLFLLSLLVHLNDRKRMALIAGTFVLVSGAIYYAFMAAWLNVFLLVGISALLRGILGSVALAIGAVNIKDFLRSGKGFSLSIPESTKLGLYARMRDILNAESLLLSIVGVAVLAVVVNFIELICTAGFPAIYTSILAQQEISAAAHYGYLGLYIIGYIVDDSIMVATAVIALSSRKLSEGVGRWLKLISGTVMLVLGTIMIFKPEWLSY